MNLRIKKSDIILFVMDYLKNEGLFKSLLSLEEETNVNLFDFHQQIAFLRKLVIDGQWTDAEEFLKPLQEHPHFEYKPSIFEIRKQKFLEAVEADPENEKNDDELLSLLTQIQSLSTPEVFNQLMLCLSTPSIKDHAEYKNWSPAYGRLKCFNKIRSYLEIIYPVTKEETKVTSGTFMRSLKRLAVDSTQHKMKIPKSNKTSSMHKDVNFNLACLEQYLYTEPDVSFKVELIDDTIKKTSTAKDDDELYKSTQSNLNRTNRNEKISRSLQLNKISDIENETTDYPLNLLQSKKIEVVDNLDQVIEEELNAPSEEDKNYNDSECEEKINEENKAQDLSDLDKEEFFMKSCYEFYDYDISSLAMKRVIEDTHPIRTSCFSPKGDYFSIGTNSKSVKIFQMKQILSKFNKKNTYNFKKNDDEHLTDEDTNEIKLIFEQKNHHLGSIYCLDWSISGRLIASGSNDKMVKLMVVPDLDESFYLKDQETLELPIAGHKGTVRSVCFEPTSDLVLLSAGTVDTCIKVWDTEKGLNKTNLEGHTNDIYSIKWSNDSLLCGSSGVDKTIRFWDLRECKSTSLISAIKYSDINDISIFTRNKSYSSTLVAAGHVDGTITIWDYNKKNLVKEIQEHSDEVRSLSFSPDGRYLVSASFDSKLKIFDVENKFELIGELEHYDRVVSLKWHPEVPMLISTSADKTARIWMPDSI